MKRVFKSVVASALAVSIAISASAAAFAAPDSNPISVGGSTTIYPLSNNIINGFTDAKGVSHTGFASATGVNVTLTAGGSGAGLNGVVNNTLDVGMMSRDLKDSEKSQYPLLVPITVGKDAICIIVNKASTISDLSLDQIKTIFSTGSNSTWNVYSREAGSGTLDGFQTLFGVSTIGTHTEKTSNQDMINAVANDTKGIAYVSFGVADAQTSVKILSVGGAVPNVPNARSGAYPYVRDLNLVTRKEPIKNSLKFIEFFLSSSSQAAFDNEGYLKIDGDSVNIETVSDFKTVADAASSDMQSVIPNYLFKVDVASDSKIISDVNASSDTSGTNIGVIERDLTSDEKAAGLIGQVIGHKSDGTVVTAVTKGAAKGGKDLWIRTLRNPKGQKHLTDNGFNRAWLFGDVNNDGVIDVADYSLLRQFLLSQINSFSQPSWQYAADVTGDGSIDVADYSIMRQFLLGSINHVPAMDSYANMY